MVANQLCRIVVGISSKIWLGLSTYRKIIVGLMFYNACWDDESSCTYSEIQVSQSISESENGKRPATVERGIMF